MLTKTQRESYLQLAQMWRKLANEAGSHRLRVEAWTRTKGDSASPAAQGSASRVPALEGR